MICYLGFFYVFFSTFIWLILFFFRGSIFVQLRRFRLRLFDYFRLSLYVDYYRLMYIFVLRSIVGRIHFFIIYYMVEDLNLFRFVLVLNVFVLSMMVLIVSPNLMFIILGWDGLGFSSFLLVAWFGCYVSRVARLKTFLINRLGDGFFLISLYYFFSQGHFGLYGYDLLLVIVRLRLVVCFYTKRAHFPFRRWLPDAMAAPTPVSALVHSSTLVTAGLYMIFRFYYLLSWDVLFLVHNLGLWTLFLGRLGACLDKNSKKVVAYSTIRQLGLLRYIISLGFFDLFFYYMMVHALFKALLFIAVGRLMILKFHKQDVRHLGRRWFHNPLVTFKLFFRVFSLSGFPFLSGYYIKELVVKGGICKNLNIVSLFLFVCSILFTVIYSFRLYNSMLGKYGWIYRSLKRMVFLPYWIFLYLNVAVVQFGILLYIKYFFWLNFGSSVEVLLIGLFGFIIRVYFFIKLSWFRLFVDFVGYVIYMFNLNVITGRLNCLYLSGRYFYEALDKGVVLFSFIKRMNYLFKIIINFVFRNQFFLKWSYLLIITFVFIVFLMFF